MRRVIIMKPYAYFLFGWLAMTLPVQVSAQKRVEKSVAKDMRNIEQKTLIGTILDEIGRAHV